MNQRTENALHYEPALSVRVNPTPMAMVFPASAAAACELIGLPAWTALAGWLAYFTRGSTWRDGAYNLACTVTGLGLGIVAYAVDAGMAPILGIFALLTSLLVAVGGIYLVQLMTGVENIPGYLLGVLAMLASGMPPTLDSYLILTAGVTVGACSAFLPDMFSRKSNAMKTETKN